MTNLLLAGLHAVLSSKASRCALTDACQCCIALRTVPAAGPRIPSKAHTLAGRSDRGALATARSGICRSRQCQRCRLAVTADACMRKATRWSVRYPGRFASGSLPSVPSACLRLCRVSHMQKNVPQAVPRMQRHRSTWQGASAPSLAVLPSSPISQMPLPA